MPETTTPVVTMALAHRLGVLVNGVFTESEMMWRNADEDDRREGTMRRFVDADGVVLGPTGDVLAASVELTCGVVDVTITVPALLELMAQGHAFIGSL